MLLYLWQSCISKRNRYKDRGDDGDKERDTPKTRRSPSFNEDCLRAVKAEKQRKLRQQEEEELGLPEMPELFETVPLTSGSEDSRTVFLDGNEVRLTPRQGICQQSSFGGYVPAGARGTTAVDGYYNNRPQNTYPPPNPNPQNVYPTPNVYPPTNAYQPLQQLNVPSQASSVAPSVTPQYGPYGYTPSFPTQDGTSCKFAYIPGGQRELTTSSCYPDYSATGSRQHPNPRSSVKSFPSMQRDPHIHQSVLVQQSMILVADRVEVSRDQPIITSRLAQAVGKDLHLFGTVR